MVDMVKVTAEVMKARYDGVAGQKVADAMNALTKVVAVNEIGSDQLYRLVDDAEFEALTAGAQAAVRDLYLLETVSIRTGSKELAVLRRVFPTGTATAAALFAAQTKVVPEFSYEIGLGYVTNARRFA